MSLFHQRISTCSQFGLLATVSILTSKHKESLYAASCIEELYDYTMQEQKNLLGIEIDGMETTRVGSSVNYTRHKYCFSYSNLVDLGSNYHQYEVQ